MVRATQAHTTTHKSKRADIGLPRGTAMNPLGYDDPTNSSLNTEYRMVAITQGTKWRDREGTGLTFSLGPDSHRVTPCALANCYLATSALIECWYIATHYFFMRSPSGGSASL